MRKKHLVFMNSGMHFWNREKEILAGLSSEYSILLIVVHEENKNYKLQDIIEYCNTYNISFLIVDNSSRRARNLLNIFRGIKILTGVLKFNPYLIYIETFSDPYFTILCFLFLNRSRVIISLMDYELHPYEENKVRFSDRFYQTLYLKFFNNFQLFSSEQAKLMRQDNPDKNVFFIPLFLIKNDFSTDRKVNKLQEADVNFLFFGKIHFYKGLDILIKAGNILSSRYSNFKITVAGSCKNFDEYEKQILNRDVFELKISYLSKEEIQELMQKADMLVLPYRQVTQSGPLMMAFYFSIIPLASDLKGFQELITDGYNGFLFKNNSVDDLVRVMEEFILMGDTHRDIIRKNLANYVSDTYTLSKFVNYYKQMFDTVTAGR